MIPIFVDESGYTGSDLLNREQQFHTVAAVNVSLDHARSILDRHFGGVQSRELKLSSMIRRQRHRAALLAALPEVAANAGAVGYVFCKRYALWLKLLEDCVEPICYRSGAPFYENGSNRSLAGLLYATAGVFWGEQQRDAILSAYQLAARSKQPGDIHRFLDSLRSIRGKELSEFFIPAMGGDRDVIDSIGHPEGTLDLSYSLAHGLITWLEAHVGAPYQIIHDKNKSIEANLGLFAAVSAIRDPATFRTSNASQISYPLKCASVATADSQTDPRLQLADLFAGSVRYSAEVLRGLKSDNGFAYAFLERIPHDALIFNLPSTDFADTKATFKGTDGAVIDFIAAQLYKSMRRTTR